MKILTINSVPYGSTARISLEIAQLCEKNDIENRLSFGYSYHPINLPHNTYRIGSKYSKLLHMVLSRISGYHGIFSIIATRIFLKKIKKYNPDIIHLHNLHGWYICIPMLFNYIKSNNIPVVWTLHDCWALTGQCTHFDMIGCSKWKSHCNKCEIINQYPSTWIDCSFKMHDLKMKWFRDLGFLRVVTPSTWLSKMVKQSVTLGNYKVDVINNGIDLNIFRPTESNFRYKYGLVDKYIILGVSFGWDEKKGLDVFIKLALELPKSFKVVLVGTDAKIEKCIPKEILTIRRTQSQRELAEIYSSANIFANFTREDTFPTVNIESLACGLPVLTFDTGGSPEIIDETCGIIVKKDDIQRVKAEILNLYSNSTFSRDKCRERAQTFSKNDRFLDYIKLYEEIYKNLKK